MYPNPAEDTGDDKGTSRAPDFRRMTQKQLFHGRNSLKHPYYGFRGSDDPLTMVAGLGELLPLIPEAAASHPSPAVSMT